MDKNSELFKKAITDCCDEDPQGVFCIGGYCFALEDWENLSQEEQDKYTPKEVQVPIEQKIKWCIQDIETILEDAMVEIQEKKEKLEKYLKQKV